MQTFQPAYRKRSSVNLRVMLLRAAAALAVLASRAPATAQDIPARLPSFQAPASNNLESEMMSRISVTGQLEPGDLPRLARLAVLNSISMLVNVRTDLPNSLAGAQLEQELASLWDSSEAFYEVVSESPLDAESAAGARYWLEAVGASQQSLQASLGNLPGLSPQAAGNLRSLSRLLVPIDSAIGSIESSLPRPMVEQAPDVDSLRRQAQLAANDLVSLVGKAGDAGRGRAARDAVITELTDLLERVQTFSRLLAIRPSLKTLHDSYRLVRRQTWRVESRLSRLEWKAGLERPWRDVRDRLAAISTELGLPRVIEIPPVPRTLTIPERAAAAHVDHAVAWLDEFLAVSRQSLRMTQVGTGFLTDAVSLRNKLLNLRRRMIAGDPPERLAELLKDIDSANESLSNRAGSLTSNDTAGPIESRYRKPAEAVRKIKSVIVKS
jgi:hypothetical protein